MVFELVDRLVALLVVKKVDRWVDLSAVQLAGCLVDCWVVVLV